MDPPTSCGVTLPHRHFDDISYRAERVAKYIGMLGGSGIVLEKRNMVKVEIILSARATGE